MCNKATIAVYVILVQSFKNTTIVAYAGLGVKSYLSFSDITYQELS